MRTFDGDRIRCAIDEAERGTSGRIGVRVVAGKTGDALQDARRHFVHAHLHEHAHHNAVVFFLAPKVRRFAIVGDDAIHECVGGAFWQQVVDEMQPYFARGEMTQGLVHGIARVGEKLREHFGAQVIA